MEWVVNASSIAAWAGVNASVKGPAFLWWEKAELLGDALADWYGEWYNDLANPVTNATENGALQMTAGGANISTAISTEFACNVDGVGVVWTNGALTDNDSAAACKAACFDKTAEALLGNANTSTPNVDNGGGTIPAYTGAGTGWCGAYSFNDSPDAHHNSE
jgi:hypothetical protein